MVHTCSTLEEKTSKIHIHWRPESKLRIKFRYAGFRKWKHRKKHKIQHLNPSWECGSDMQALGSESIQIHTTIVGTHEHQIIRMGGLKCLIRFCPGDLSIVQGFCEVKEVTNSPYPLIFHSLVKFPKTLVSSFPISRAISSFRNLLFWIVVLRATCSA